MANDVFPAILIFTILCLVFVSNTLEDDLISSYDVSSKDSAEIVSSSASASKHSSRKIYLPSEWSKEENENLKSSDDKEAGNAEQGIFAVGEESSLWNIKNLFQFFKSFLHVVNQNNEGSLDKSINDVKTKTLNHANNDLPDKSENNEKDELQNSVNTDTLNKSKDDGKMQKSSSTGTQNKSSDDWKMSKLWNDGTLDQATKNSEIRMQNSMGENSLQKSKNSMKTETHNLAIIGTPNKSTHGEENFISNNILNKKSDDVEEQNVSNNTQPKENSKIKVKNSRDKKKFNEPEGTAKTELQNPANADYLNESTDYVKLQNSETNDSVNKSMDNVKMKNPSNKHSSNIQNLTKDSKNKMRTHMNIDYLNRPTENIKMQNPSNNDIQRESISALTSDKSKDSTMVTFEDDENSNMNEITSDDTEANDTSEEETSEYDVYNNNEKQSEDNTGESKLDDDYINDCDDEDNTSKNTVENDYLNENKYNESNNDENEVRNDYVNQSNDDNDGNKSVNNTEIHETAIVADKIAHNTSTIFPKFLIQIVPDQQNNPETFPNRNQIINNDSVTPEDIKSQTLKNEENPWSKFELTGGEFIDDYINNRGEKIPERQNEQSNTTEALIPNATNDAILIQIPTSVNNFQENNRPLFTNPSVNENTKSQNILFVQSENPADNFWTEKNILPLPVFNEDIKNANPNQASPYENSQNIQNTLVIKPASSVQENVKADEIMPVNFIPFQQKPHYIDLPYIFPAPHEDYNIFTQPSILKFQNNNPSVKAPHNSAPDTNAYRSETTNPFQLIFNKVVPMQNEGYLNDQYTNNFEDAKSSAVISNENLYLEQKQPIILKQDMLSSVQYVPNQDTPNSPDIRKYFTNYIPEMALNKPNIETLVPVMEMPSNYWISDNLQYNPYFNQLYNQESSFTDNENSLIKTDKTVPQVQPDATAPQNQIDKIKTINMQSQSDILPSQNIFPEQQILFPQSVTEKSSLESKMNSRTQLDENKITSEILPTQNEFKNIEFPSSQNNTNNSKELPLRSSGITEVNLENKSRNAASIIPKNIPAKSFSPKTKTASSKPLNGKFEKSIFFDESEGYNHEISFFDFDSSKSDSYGEFLDLEYDAEESCENEYDEEDSYESEYDEEDSYDSEYDEEESYENVYDEEESYDSEYDEEESYEKEYDEEESYESEYYKEESEKSTNISDGTINNAAMQIPQKSSTGVNDVTKSPVTFQTQKEAVPYSDQKGNFNTILEYIYKFSDSSLFKGLKN